MARDARGLGHTVKALNGRGDASHKEAGRILQAYVSRRQDNCSDLLGLWCGLGDVYKMAEGRRCHVHLLDGRMLELLVQPKLLAKELLDMVASHFNLKEKEFFGLAYVDETGLYSWLQLDRRVLEHDFPKKSRCVVLNFTVKFYIESVAYLRENTAVELFFLNAKTCISKGIIEVDSETAFELSAYILQEAAGDYTCDDAVRSELKTLPPLPTLVLKEHPSIGYCEERIIEHYKKLKGQTRGQAIVNYMSVVETLPSYGVHYYPVKDKKGLPWWLGLSNKGISQYDFQDKLKPRQIYQWRQLENLYFREKKFSIEVHDPRRLTVSRRTFAQSGITVHTWYASPALIKSIWVMAIGQHQFYLDRKQSKAKIPVARSLSEIAIDLTELGSLSTSGLASMGSESKIISGSDGSLFSSGSQESEISQEARKDLMTALKSRRDALEDTLKLRVEELRLICLREADLTGKLPEEFPLALGEKAPSVRRRVGTSFKLDEHKIIMRGEEAELERLERDFAIQSQITEAAKRLASDPGVSKKARKQRKSSYQNSVRKLQDIEAAINQYRLRAGQEPTKRTSHIGDEDSPRSSLLSSLLSPQRLVPPLLGGYARPSPPTSLEGLRRQQSFRGDPSSPSKSGSWAESSLDEPYDRPRKPLLRHTMSSPLGSPSHQPGCQRAKGTGSLQTSPVKAGPRWDSSSVPSTPDSRTRAIPFSQHQRWFESTLGEQQHQQHQQQPLPAAHLRQRSCSLESQSQLLVSEGTTVAGGDLSCGTGTVSRSSNSSELPLDDHSSYTSQSSSECGYYGGPGGRTPYDASRPGRRASAGGADPRALQRHRSAESLVSEARGEMQGADGGGCGGPGGGGGPGGVGGARRAGLYRFPHNVPTSQYRVKEYPLYADRADGSRCVVRSLESEREGHYCVKAQVRTSHSYTAGGMYRERVARQEGGAVVHSITQSRSQVVRSCCQEGVRTSTLEHLRSWYERNAYRDPRRLSHVWSDADRLALYPQGAASPPPSKPTQTGGCGGGSRRNTLSPAHQAGEAASYTHQPVQHTRSYSRITYYSSIMNRQRSHRAQHITSPLATWHKEDHIQNTARLT
uniref:FERM domain-containing protein 4A isoform X2 n=1 Tax=Petromyzon marinus TaxID=7757 RepID=A0AAJ7WU54_PETMA|nr:FERM domain-containing protein 4A isoform X2 [Petromyzon marinus]